MVDCSIQVVEDSLIEVGEGFMVTVEFEVGLDGFEYFLHHFDKLLLDFG
jgi:hypothetical protein